MESKAKTLIPENVIGIKSDKKEIILTEKDTILYSLGIGISEDPYNESDLDFTYEFSENFKIFPTQFSCIPIYDAVKLMIDNPNIPEYNHMSLLHGENNLVIHKQAIHNEKYYYQLVLIDYEDKGFGTVFLFECNITNNKDHKFYTIYSSMIIRDFKGNKHKSKGPLLKLTIPKIPDVIPDFTTKYKTTRNQALLYRLGGLDPNPLHADIKMAQKGGFDKPILHGMCFYGIACRAINDLICARDINNIINFNARFTNHVYPGETLEVSIWKQKGNKLIISLATSERKKQVLIGEAELRNPKF